MLYMLSGILSLGKKLLSWVLPGVLGSLGTNAVNHLVNSSLTGKEREQNAFNASQAELQRSFAHDERLAAQEFNSEQASRQMAFQERMDSSLYQRRVADMQAAGLNPALATGSIPGASTAGASASVSPASGSSATGSTSLAGLSSILELARAKKEFDQIDAQISLMDSQALRERASAGLAGAQEEYTRTQNTWFAPLTQTQINDLNSAISRREVQSSLDRQGISESEARRALLVEQTAIAHADASVADELAKLRVRMQVAELGQMPARLANIQAQTNELYQRAIMESLQGGLYSAEELESLERAGLIREEKRGAELENEAKKYSVDHKGLTYWLGVGTQAAGIVSSVVGSSAKAAAGFAFARNGASFLPSGSFSMNPSSYSWR